MLALTIQGGDACSDFLHIEIILGHAAIRAGPGIGHVFPAGAGGDAVFGQTGRLVIDEAADDAHPGAKWSGIGAGFLHDAECRDRGRCCIVPFASPERMALNRFPKRGLYLITPDDGDSESLLTRVRDVLPYAACLQYRRKHTDAAQRRREAEYLRLLCHELSICFIVNDDPVLAEEVDADGVHLGESDGGIANARQMLGADRCIGVSCYDDASLAQSAASAGADYVAFGAMFPSSTKPHARRATPALFAQTQGLGVPRVAIGGITPDNAPIAIAAGADLLAVIGGVFDAPDPIAAARSIAAAFN